MLNLSKFLLSSEFRKEIKNSDQIYILCKNGSSEFVIHNLKAFEQLYDLADFGKRMMDIQKYEENLDRLD